MGEPAPKIIYGYRYTFNDIHSCGQTFPINPLVAELFCHKFDLLEIVSFLCTFLQHAAR